MVVYMICVNGTHQDQLLHPCPPTFSRLLIEREANNIFQQQLSGLRWLSLLVSDSFQFVFNTPEIS